MATFKVPNTTGAIRQPNNGDRFGELTETFNVDLSSSLGKMKLSEKMLRVLQEGVDIGTPSSANDIIIYGSQIYFITEDEVYKCSVLSDPTNSANWAEEAAIADIDTESTAAIFGGNLVISLNTNILQWNGTTDDPDWWTAVTSGTALTAGVPHVLHTHKGGQETLFVTDNNRVRYYNTTSGHTSILLQSDLTACCLDSGIDSIWVGTFNETSGNAYVYEIRVGQTVADRAIEVDGRAVLALWVQDNVPHIVTEQGNIQAFNGAGFTTVASFPFIFTDRPLEGVRPGNVQNSNHNRPIHPRGVKTFNNSTYILINTECNADDYASDAKSHAGVWEYDSRTSQLTHRFALAESADQFGNSTQASSGPLLILNNDDCFAIAAAEMTGSAEIGLFATTMTTNQGWFVTTEVLPDSASYTWDRVYHKASLGSSDTINTLYRTSKRDTVYGTLNWINGTDCTTTADWSTVEVGDLIRISHGYAAGEWTMVESITSSDNVYTIRVTRSIGTAGETSYAYSDNFKLVKAEYTANDGEYKSIGLNVTGPWCQVMTIFKGTDIDYREFTLTSNTKAEL